MTSPIKFGIVGLGHIGVRHAQCINDNDAAELTEIFDILPINEWRVNDTKNRASSFQDLIQKDIDVVNICTPNYLHAQMAIDVLKSGKHVVIEKPMAICTSDAQKIITTATDYDKLVFCVMQNRFSPTMIWLKDIISNKYLGKINMVSVNCFWNRNQNYYLDSNWHGSKLKDGGPLFTQFSHFIDIIYWLFGEVNSVEADFFSFNQKEYIEFEDSGIIKLNFKNDIIGILNYSTAIWNKNFESSITIIGEFGSIKIGGQYMDKIIYCDIKNYTLPDMKMNIECNDYGSYKGSASNHDKMIDNVVDVLLGNQNIHTNAIDGLNVVQIIEKIYTFRN